MTRLSWSAPTDRQFEMGLDRGVLYPKSPKGLSASTVTIGMGSKTFALYSNMTMVFKLGSLVRATDVTGVNYVTGLVLDIATSGVTLDVTDTNGSGTFSSWTLVRLDMSVPWNGMISVDENGGESATAYVIDGRPFLYLPKPKEFTANIKAYTYPDELSAIMGLAEATDGMYLDSQMGDAFDLAYRTMVGNGIQGLGSGYKIHLVYNATVTPNGISYGSVSDSVNAIEFGWDIQAVPVPIEGFRATAHITIDTRHMDADRVAEIEDLLYGTDDTPALMPPPQTIYDILNFGDRIIILDNGDGTWTAEGSYHNIYMIGDGIFQIDNVDAIDHGDGTYDISSTNV